MSFYRFLLTIFIFLGQDFCAAKQPPSAPTLNQTSVSGSSLELLCQAPQGSEGLEFKLFRERQMIDIKKYSSKQREARFVLKGEDLKKENHYCCQYDNSEYSFYLTTQLKFRSPVSPPPSPHLVVQPASDYTVPGKTLSFHCQPPVNQPAEAFFFIRRGTRVSESRSQKPFYSVKTTGREDSGDYTCLYQLTLPKIGQVNSTESRPVKITVVDLPVPSLSLSQNILECVGSPLYPQASFSLFRVGSSSPEDTKEFNLIKQRVRFPINTKRYEHDTLYQCQYSLMLGNSHLFSEMSNTVNVPCNIGSCTSTPAGIKESIDLALIIGSVSAGVLFLMVVSLLSFAIHRHLKSVAEKRRKREQGKFWQQIISRDHVVDLTLQRVDCDFEPLHGLRRKPSVAEPIYDVPLSTFTKPSLYSMDP